MSQANRMQEWYEQAFGEIYPLLYRHRDDASARREIRGLMRLTGAAAGWRVLDICCGTGRHLAGLLEAGLDAWGVDLSAALLGRAAQRPGLAGRLVRADMRALPFEASFAAAVNLFTSFGYFADEQDNQRAMRRMAGVLRPGGVLVVDHANRAKLVRELQPYSRREQGQLVIEDHRRIEGDRVVKRTQVRHVDGRTQQLTESVRLYDPREMTRLLESAGLRGVRLVGSFEGEPFTEHAPRMIAIGTKV